VFIDQVERECEGGACIERLAQSGGRDRGEARVEEVVLLAHLMRDAISMHSEMHSEMHSGVVLRARLMKRGNQHALRNPLTASPLASSMAPITNC
jgi:hypothetical protein